MTREEAIANHELARSGRKGEFRRIEMIYNINKIYDDFESRTCGSCKYFNLAETCTKEEFRDDGLLLVPYSKEFGCNKWEAKHLGDSNDELD